MNRHFASEPLARQVALAGLSGKAFATSTSTPRAQRDAAADGVVCRLGDGSCASAHAAAVQRRVNAGLAQPEHALLSLQRHYGNRFVGAVLRQASGADPGGDGMDVIERTIESARGGGQGMDHGTRSSMERAFGADFSGVRIHQDARADQLGESLSARAFTTGQDVFFRQGEYKPGSTAGRELLAHELTHVVQQTGAGIRAKLSVSQPGDAQELEADRVAQAVVREEVQRQPEAPKEEDERDKPAAAAGPGVMREEDEAKPE